MKPVAKPSFGRSVAFLAGVAQYQELRPQLPFVASDLTELRNFLLTQGGFDTVYEARDGTVKRSLIEKYLLNKFASASSGDLSKDDRLLFYYSGHGDDEDKRLGFLEFSGSTPGYFAGDDVLEVDQFAQWSRVIVAKHLLIILDACASGLADTAKAVESPAERRQLELNALSGRGSGYLITAGTADQKAYQLKISSQKGYSVFTHALLTALHEGPNDDAFMTINEVFGNAQKKVAQFDADQSRMMEPRIWPIRRSEDEAGGTFVFVNSNAKNPALPPRESGIALAKGYGDTPDADHGAEQPAYKEAFAGGVGRIRFGMTPDQVYDELPVLARGRIPIDSSPEGTRVNWSGLPQAEEYKKDKVRYFVANLSAFDCSDPKSDFVCKDLAPLHSCFTDPGYIAFDFDEKNYGLFRISVRMWWDCKSSEDNLRQFASLYDIFPFRESALTAFYAPNGSTVIEGLRRDLAKSNEAPQVLTTVEFFLGASPASQW